jgi:hypothetical protein
MMAQLGKKPNDVKARAYADPRDALAAALTGAAGERGGVAGEHECGSAAGKPVSSDSAGAYGNKPAPDRLLRPA